MSSETPVEIPRGYLSYREWELLIQESGGLHSSGSAYSIEFLRNVEIINAGWLDEGENTRIRNHFARRMRKDGWNVEVSRGWDPIEGEFVRLEAVRPRDYCRECDPGYTLPDALQEGYDAL